MDCFSFAGEFSDGGGARFGDWLVDGVGEEVGEFTQEVFFVFVFYGVLGCDVLNLGLEGWVHYLEMMMVEERKCVGERERERERWRRREREVAVLEAMLGFIVFDSPHPLRYCGTYRLAQGSGIFS